MSSPALITNLLSMKPKFKRGDTVRKTKGSQWSGKVVGEYSTDLTPEGYAVESSTEKGSVQIYPAAALELVPNDSFSIQGLQKWVKRDVPYSAPEVVYQCDPQPEPGYAPGYMLCWAQDAVGSEFFKLYVSRWYYQTCED